MLIRKLYYLKKVLAQQWKKPEEIRKLQNKKIRAMVEHAYRYVPYYRREWKKNNIHPTDIKKVEDLEKLPIITKDDVIKNYNQFIAVNYKRKYELDEIIKRTTSGSSGKPLEMIFDDNAWDYKDADYLRSLMVAGYDPRKPLVCYWYEPFEIKIYNRFGFMNKIYIPCELPETRQLEILRKIKPEFIYYFSGILYSLSRIVIKEGIAINPKLIITHAEVLTKNMKKTIANVFDAPVFDHYGSTEFGRIAWECKEEVYHLSADSVAVEMVKNGEVVNQGEMGSVVCTDLTNKLLPLIRYEIGDIAIAGYEKCSCGRGLPTLKSIEGRKSDLIKLKSGRVITPASLINDFIKTTPLPKFKILYKKYNNFKILIESAWCKNIENLEEKFNKILREKSKIKIKMVDYLPAGKRGKRKMVECIG